MVRWLIILLVCTLGCLPAWPEENLSPRKITKITSSSLSSQETSTLSKALGLQVGENLNLNQLNKNLKNTFSENLIRSLNVLVRETPQGLEVLLEGAKIRKLRKIFFEDLDSSLTQSIENSIALRSGQIIESGAVEKIKSNIRDSMGENGFFQAQVSIELREVDDGESADLVVEVSKGPPCKLRHIQIEVLDSQEKIPWDKNLNLRRGDLFSKKNIQKTAADLETQYKNNLFPLAKVEEIKTNFNSDYSEVDLKLVIRLGKRIQYIFNGNDNISDTELKELLTNQILKQNDSVKALALQIQKKYQNKGYHFCKVENTQEFLSKENLLIVKLFIDEGPKVKIRSVSFSQVEPLDLSTLTDWFYASASGVLNRGIFVEEQLKETTLKFENYLRLEGFLSARVLEPRVTFFSNSKYASLFFDLELGVRTFVASMEFPRSSTFSKKELLEKMELHIGDPVNYEEIEKARNQLITFYKTQGYIEVEIEPISQGKNLRLSNDQRQATLIFSIQEGNRFKVGNVTITGVKRTQPKVVEREVRLEKSEYFNPQKLIETEDNIATLGLFNRIEAKTKVSNPKENMIDVEIGVQESKPGIGELGLGAFYEEPRLRIRPFAGLAYRNLFGLNQTASARAELSLPFSRNNYIPFIEYSTVLGYRAPYLLDLPFTFQVQTGLDRFEVNPLEAKLLNRARIETRLEKKLGTHWTFFYRLLRLERIVNEQRQTATTPASEEIESIGSTGPGIVLDLRNNVFNPTQGSYHTLDLELATPVTFSQSDISFLLTQSRNSFYFPIFSPIYISFYIGLGYANSLYGNSPLPRARLVNELALGGQGSIRGISPRSIAANIQTHDTAFYNFRSEVAYEFFENISFAVFFDSGQIFPDFRTNDRVDGVGVGLRYKTPVGPLTVDVAQGFGPVKEEVKFYFAVGSL